MSVLEIFPPLSYRGRFAHPPTYFWTAHALGFDYDALYGQPAHEEDRLLPYDVEIQTVMANWHRPFEVNADELSRRIEAML
ncbi:MAG: hypothetical protein ACREKF_15125 [Candidatus Methylomirabilales bacterium]